MKRIFIFLAMALLTCVSLQAGIKERLAERLPTINKLKEALVVGEDNKGYLSVKGKISDVDQKTVDAENADRKEIYEMLASKTGASIEKVQTRRAEQIAQKSKKGIWLQKADGSWYKK